MIVGELGGPEPSPLMLDALVAYMTEFDFLPAPLLARDGTLNDRASAAAGRGEAIFNRPFAGMAGRSCAACHIPDGNFVDGRRHDIGSVAPSSPHARDGALDTPTLAREPPYTAPYFHDGSLATLAAVVDWFDRRYQLGPGSRESGRTSPPISRRWAPANNPMRRSNGKKTRFRLGFDEASTFLSTLETLIPARDRRHALLLLRTVGRDLRADAAGMTNTGALARVVDLARKIDAISDAISTVRLGDGGTAVGAIQGGGGAPCGRDLLNASARRSPPRWSRSERSPPHRDRRRETNPWCSPSYLRRTPRSCSATFARSTAIWKPRWAGGSRPVSPPTTRPRWRAWRRVSADIAFMGALPYVMARARIGASALLSEVYRGKPTYRGAIFVRRGSGIARLQDLRGKSIAFADPISESGFLYPLDLFVEAGLLAPKGDPKAFFGQVYFAGGYQQAIQAVANGLVDAAGVSIYATLLLDVDRRGAVTAIARTPPIPSHVVVARRGLGARDRARPFVEAMLALNAPGKRHLLKHVYGPDGYVMPDHAAYDGVAAIARKYGLIR